MTPTVDTKTVKTALGFAQEAALTLAKGPAATGFVVTKKGAGALRDRRKARKAAQPQTSRRITPVRALAVVGGVVLVTAGAAVVGRLRGRELPPVADAPPSLGTPSTNGASTNGSSAHTTS
ncbi:hypothetical protein ACNHUS_25255 [Actinomycetes bacterium M1A6_2h]